MSRDEEEKSSISRDTTKDTERAKNSKWSTSDIIGFVLFVGCWVVFSAFITLWVADKGFNIVLAIIAGIVGGFITTVISWILGRGGV